MPQVYITRRLHFSASHRMYNPSYSEEWNKAAFGHCANPNGHGHNYYLDVTVVGTPAPETGHVLDLGVLKKIVTRHVVGLLDHRNLNVDVDFMEGILPSTENLAIAIWNQLEPHIPSGRLHRIRLYETERQFAEYFGPGGE